eukprot:TRINITY_DN2709_c0_g1_i3.p1 TRINITY_DN2709_c0_g1~~TRINITY_DN2709_c0_g1_i3.p1  ORF type:complete len:259 (-),score=39.10 TRINITY_DN2709_c0_g1_i3:160-936(-)
MIRTVSGDGFHRDLNTQISLDTDQHRLLINPDPHIHYTNCTIMMVETLLNGVFLDQYEIQDRERLKVPGDSTPHVHFFREMDVERPSYLSPSNIVLVYYHFDPRPDTPRVFNITLPIHFRYQLPSSKETHHKVVISSPLTYLHCNGIPPMPALDHLNQPSSGLGWNKLEVSASPPSPSSVPSRSTDSKSVTIEPVRVVLDVPVGQRGSEWTVMAVSLAVTLLGAFITIHIVDSHAPSLVNLQYSVGGENGSSGKVKAE